MNENFIFCNELRQALELFIARPEIIPSPLCFYGEPGTGKTTFAEYLADHVAAEMFYYDMNEFKANGASAGKLLDSVKAIASGRTITRLFDESKAENAVWRTAIILDEWHNATIKQQDGYKVPFEKYGKDNKTLFILCLNTTQNEGLERRLSSAIRSRCHAISFNTKSAQTEELVGLIKKRFPKLNKTMIRGLLPDLRRIEREAKLQTARSG